MSNNFVDKCAICPYCGDFVEYPNEKQIKIFGKPTCCEYEMVVIDREKLHKIARALDTLKQNIENELLKGVS